VYGKLESYGIQGNVGIPPHRMNHM